MPRTVRMLEASSSHIPGPNRHMLNKLPGASAFRTDTASGWMLWVPVDVDEWDAENYNNIPSWLLKLLRYARELNCSWIHFDPQLPMLDELKPYEPETQPIAESV